MRVPPGAVGGQIVRSIRRQEARGGRGRRCDARSRDFRQSAIVACLSIVHFGGHATVFFPEENRAKRSRPSSSAALRDLLSRSVLESVLVHSPGVRTKCRGFGRTIGTTWVWYSRRQSIRHDAIKPHRSRRPRGAQRVPQMCRARNPDRCRVVGARARAPTVLLEGGGKYSGVRGWFQVRKTHGAHVRVSCRAIAAMISVPRPAPVSVPKSDWKITQWAYCL